MDRTVVIGGGGHAKVLISLLKKSGHQIAGYTSLRDAGSILDVPHIGDDSVLSELLRTSGRCQAVVGLGKVDTSPRRVQLAAELESLGFILPVIVSPHAVVNEGVAMGSGTVVFDGAVINSGTKMGSLCIANTNCTIEHDCRLGDNVHVAPGATLSGGVTVGDNSMIGAGSTVVQDASICADCLVGAGSTVIADIAAPGTYAGNPVKRIR